MNKYTIIINSVLNKLNELSLDNSKLVLIENTKYHPMVDSVNLMLVYDTLTAKYGIIRTQIYFENRGEDSFNKINHEKAVDDCYLCFIKELLLYSLFIKENNNLISSEGYRIICKPLVKLMQEGI